MEYLKGGSLNKEGSITIENSNLEKFTDEKAATAEATSEAPINKNGVSTAASVKEEALAQVTWEKLKQGDLDALGELYDLYVDELYGYGMGKVPNKTRVMDSIHDLFVDLYKYRLNLSTPANVKFYLLKSLRRKIYRKQSSGQQINLEDSLENRKIGSFASYEEELIQTEHASERDDKLKLALSFLTLRQQKALHLKFTENLPYSEIAAAMDISIATSRTLVYRALSVLRKHCGPLILFTFKLFF